MGRLPEFGTGPQIRLGLGSAECSRARPGGMKRGGWKGARDFRFAICDLRFSDGGGGLLGGGAGSRVQVFWQQCPNSRSVRRLIWAWWMVTAGWSIPTGALKLQGSLPALSVIVMVSPSRGTKCGVAPGAFNSEAFVRWEFGPAHVGGLA
jgi:hypothetical protein